MVKRSFSVVMLALMVAPTYAMFGADEVAPTEAMKEARRMVGNTIRSTFQQVSGDETETPAAPQAPVVDETTKKVIDTAKENLNEHIEKIESPSEGSGPSSSDEGDEPKQNEDPKDEGSEPKKNDALEDKGSEKDEQPTKNDSEEEKKSEEPKSGFISRCTDKVVGGFVSSKNAVVGGISAVGAGIYAGASNVLNAGLKTGKFAVSTVDPRTYWNAGKDLVTGKEGLTRFEIIKGHKAAVTGIVAATLASVGYVYREEIVEYGKKAYNWTANQVQSLRNYIQG